LSLSRLAVRCSLKEVDGCNQLKLQCDNYYRLAKQRAANSDQRQMSHSIGDFEQLILLALVHLGQDAYGVTIRQEIESRAARAVSPGALYTALDRLEKRGFVTSRLGEPTPERGGKRKRLYTLQPAGERALARIHESLRLMARGIAARLRTVKG
jgi:PadR family transcriptional regulator, regulatory protein PadR